MRISKEWKQMLLDRIDIIDYAEWLSLPVKRKGKHAELLCTWRNDNHYGSCRTNKSGKRFVDYAGDKTSYDAISLTMQAKQCSFFDAVKIAADYAHMPLPSDDNHYNGKPVCRIPTVEEREFLGFGSPDDWRVLALEGIVHTDGYVNVSDYSYKEFDEKNNREYLFDDIGNPWTKLLEAGDQKFINDMVIDQCFNKMTDICKSTLASLPVSSNIKEYTDVFGAFDVIKKSDVDFLNDSMRELYASDFSKAYHIYKNYGGKKDIGQLLTGIVDSLSQETVDTMIYLCSRAAKLSGAEIYRETCQKMCIAQLGIICHYSFDIGNWKYDEANTALKNYCHDSFYKIYNMYCWYGGLMTKKSIWKQNIDNKA